MRRDRPNDTFIIYGEQSSGSSVIFLYAQVFLLGGRRICVAALRTAWRGIDAAVGIVLPGCAGYFS